MPYVGPNKRDLEAFGKNWDRWAKMLKEEYPAAKKRGLDLIGQDLLSLLQQAIRSSTNDRRWHVRRWQEYRVGSGAGYVAVSADGSEVITTNREGISAVYNSYQMTRWINHGHKVRDPSGRAKRYVPRLDNCGRGEHGDFVPGRLFYADVRVKLRSKLPEFEKIIEESIMRPISERIREMNGGGT